VAVNNTMKFIAMHLLITIVGAFMTGIMVFFLVAYGIPLFLDWVF
jgi:hypothetical protein